MMAAFAGWVLIFAIFVGASLALLMPALRFARRRSPVSGTRIWVLYLASVIGLAVALWYLIPFLVWIFFGRKMH